MGWEGRAVRAPYHRTPGPAAGAPFAGRLVGVVEPWTIRPHLPHPVPLHTHRPEGGKRKAGGGQTWSLWPGGLPEESELQPCGAPDVGLDQVCSQILTESDDTAVVTTDWWWVAVCPSVGG